MGLLDRLLRRPAGVRRVLRNRVSRDRVSRQPMGPEPVDAAREDRLRHALDADPNDTAAFRELVEIVRRRAAEGHDDGGSQRAADDAVWALAEEVARSPRSWYALIELGRLSVQDDREGALRRVTTAAERDPSGHALAEALQVLRDAALYDDALSLGVGHWRPREHELEAGRQVVHAAIDAGRLGEARRHLDNLALHPGDEIRVASVRGELERALGAAEAGRGR